MAERVKLISIENSNRRNFDGIKQRAGSTQGMLNVWVNPYATYPERGTFYGDFKHSPEYIAARDEQIKLQGQQGAPVVIFQESGDPGLKSRLAKSGFEGEALVISTLRGDSNPCWISWNTLGKRLTESGIGEVSVGGAFLWRHDVSNGGNVRVPRVSPSPSTDYLPARDALNLVNSYVQGLSLQSTEAAEWIASGRIPGGAVGLTAINFLRLGINPRISAASALHS